MNEPQIIADTAKERLELWRKTVQVELQDLMQQASALRHTIDTAKTETKKRLYRKKFKKVTDQVLQMLAALQRLDTQGANLEKQTKEVVANDAPVTA